MGLHERQGLTRERGQRPREMQTKTKPQRAMEMGETEVTRET